MLKRTLLAGALLCACAAPALARHHHRHHHWHHRHAHVAAAPDGNWWAGQLGRRQTVDARASGRPLELHALVDVARKYLGHGRFAGMPGRWCAAFQGKILQEAGFRRLPSMRARDYARYGRPTHPHVGAIAVLPHHIGTVARVVQGGVILVSGNHSRRVGEGFYAFHRIIAFRDPV